MIIPLACDMTAIPADEREAHRILTEHLMASAASIRDVPRGLAVQWPATAYAEVTRFIDSERRCCPFLTFTLTILSGGGPLDLRLTGPEGVTAFLRAELHLPTP